VARRRTTRFCAKFETEDLDTPVELWQQGKDNFTVIYGLEEKEGLNYTAAAMALGTALMHSLACKGSLDNREKGER
jgi:hypothetical protein